MERLAFKWFFGGDVLEAVIQRLMGSNADFLASLQRFFDAHAGAFDPAVEEYRLEYTGIHNAFTALVEDAIGDVLREKRTSQAAFRDILARAEALDPSVGAFVHILLLATDFRLFVEIMKRRDKRDYFLHVLRSWAAELRAR